MSNRGSFEQVGVEAVVKGFDAYVRQMKELVGQTQKAGQQIGAASGDADKLGKSLDISAGSILKFGAAIAGAQLGVAAIRGAFSNTIGAAIEFESSFAGVRKTVDATEEEFAKLAQGFRDLAKTIPVNVNELNRIGEAAGQLGIAKEDILAFTETVAKLSATTSLTSDQAATDLARLANVVGFTAEEFDNVASVIVALGNAGASTEPEILAFAQRIAGAGEIAGLTIDEILGIGEAMSSVGIEAEAGGTAVQKVLLQITEAVATGNDDLAIFASTAGLSAEQFAAAWEQDAGNAFALFVEGLGRSGTQAFQILDELDLKDQRLIRSFLSLSGAGDLLRNSLDNASNAMKSTSAIDEEFAKRQETTAAQLQLLQNRLADVGISVGQVLLPAINDAIGAGLDFAGSLDVLVPLVEALMDVLPSVAPVLLAIAAAMAAIQVAKLATGMATLTGSVIKAHPALSALSLAFIAIDTVLRKTTGDGLIERFTSALDGNAKAAEAAKDGLEDYDLALRAAGSGADPLAVGLAAIDAALRDASEAQTKFLQESNPLQQRYVDLSEVTEEYAGTIAGTISAMQEQGVSATELRRLIELMPPGIREVVEANIDLAGIMADSEGEFIDAARSAAGYGESMFGVADALGGIPEPAEEVKSLTAEMNEEFAKAKKSSDDFKTALEGMLSPLASMSPEVIILNTQIAQLDQKIWTLEHSTGELTQAQKDELEASKDLREELDNQRGSYENAISVVDEYADEISTLNGVPREAVLELGQALVDTGRDGEFVDEVFGRIRTALNETDASAAIEEFQTLRAELSPEEWESAAAVIGPDVLEAIRLGFAEGPARVAFIAEMEALGLSSGQALALGMMGSINDMYLAGAELAAAGVAGAAGPEGLDTGSPSRKMMELGEQAGLGLAIGFTNSTGTVLDAVTGLITVVRAEFDGALGGFLAGYAESSASRAFVDQFGDLGGRVADAFSTALATKTESSGKSLNTAVQRLIDEAEEAGVPNARELGDSLISAMAEALESGSPELVQSALVALGEFTDAIEAAAPDAGKTFIDSFLQGYEDARADRALEERVGSDGARLIDLLNDAVESKTPETAARLGEFTEGFIDELTEGLSPDKAEGIATILFDAVDDVIQGRGEDSIGRLLDILAEIERVGASRADLSGGGETGVTPLQNAGGPPGREVNPIDDFPYRVSIAGRDFPVRITDYGQAQMMGTDGVVRNVGLADIGATADSPLTHASIDDLIRRGVIRAAASGENYVPRDNMLYALHRGEAVIPAAQNPYASFLPGNQQTSGGDTSIVIDLSGATLTGSVQDNEAMLTRVVQNVISDELGHGAFTYGVRRG